MQLVRTKDRAVFSIYLYIIIALIVLLIIFIVRQVRLRRAIARRHALRQRQSSGGTEK